MSKSPAGPFETHLTASNRVLVRGPCGALFPPRPTGFPAVQFYFAIRVHWLLVRSRHSQGQPRNQK
ncbi:MAG TPA: hypothetical protein VLG49_03400 [Rhabdochlamydiaceae bacterium]|nr:hypothetical protein [Rhabdochlamydiaceae bacterium]